MAGWYAPAQLRLTARYLLASSYRLSSQSGPMRLEGSQEGRPLHASG